MIVRVDFSEEFSGIKMGKKRSRDEEGSDVEKKAKRLEPSMIKNKMKRGEVYDKLKHEKKMEKKKCHKTRNAAEKRALELGEEVTSSFQ